VGLLKGIMPKHLERKIIIRLLKTRVILATLLSNLPLLLTCSSGRNSRPWMNSSLSPDMRAASTQPTPGDDGPEVNYTEGLKVGYKWYEAENKEPLFPFGFGLSYTTFSYPQLKVPSGRNVQITFTLKNAGSRRVLPGSSPLCCAGRRWELGARYRPAFGLWAGGSSLTTESFAC
jgi:hypothetical protein